MRLRYIVFFIVIFVVAFLNNLTGTQENSTEQDNWGKVIGQIIDPETSKPVNEKFNIRIYVWNFEGEPRGTVPKYKTDDNGRIEMKLPPGIWGILCSPESPNSKYTFDYPPFYESMPVQLQELFRYSIKVEKGKITKFIRKAHLGGSIKVVLTDLQDRSVDPKLVFPGRLIRIDAYFSNLRLMSERLGKTLQNGEITCNRFFPDNNWEVHLEFKGLGYENMFKTNVEVKAKGITEVRIPIDVNDRTGVEGNIVDRDGNVAKAVRISFIQKNRNIKGHFFCYTDDQGYYLMTGMSPGVYEILVFNGERYFFRDLNFTVDITKNSLLRKNFKLDTEQ